MNCHEATTRLSESGAIDPDLQEHLNSCPACREVASAFRSSASIGPDPAHLAAIQQQLAATWKPVRALPSTHAQFALLWAMYAATAVAVPVLLGFFGVRAMHVWQAVIYDGAFAAVATCATLVTVERLNPGMRSRWRGSYVLSFGAASLTVLVLLLFPDLSVAHFARGVRCIETGCAVAAFAALLFAFALRRTFASSPVAAGAAVGFLAGLCGTTALALHCAVLTTPHIVVWHLTVLLIASAAGAFAGWFRRVVSTASR